ncbi:condensation domain-containing protein [Nonomuraea sp. NPDC052265]|uniref:condensation domain-containing protein n=1 Tax=Nonomuraea sp. NPDC052265 TaxID=3364374 RepID=UPI0037C5115B
MRVVGIKFAGLDETSGPLTWAQEYMWKMIHMASPGTRSQFNMAAYVRIPDGVTFQQVVMAFHSLIERHEGYRTVYRADAGGALEQHVLGAGAVEIDVVDLPEPFAADSRQAEELFNELLSEEFDLGKEWPYRATLLCLAGAPALLVVVLSHLTADGSSSALLQRELTTLLLKCGTGRDMDDHGTVVQQLHIAAHQRSAAGQAGSERSMRHWERVLSRYYRSGQERARHEGSLHRVRTVSMTSRRLEAFASMTARRCNTTPSTVFIAATAFAYATITGRAGLILEVACSNRTRNWAETHGTMFQFGIAEFPATGAGFDVIVKGSAAAALSAYACSQYDPVALEALRQRLSGGTGHYSRLPAIPFVINDIVGRHLTAADSNISPDQAHRHPPAFSEFGEGDPETGGYAFYLGYHRAKGGDLRIGLEFDTRILSCAEAVGCLKAIDGLLLKAGRADLSLAEAQNIVQSCLP